MAGDPFRFSIVYTLRPAVAPLFTKVFESGITGVFDPQERCEGESSAVLFDRIMRSHWNINAAKEVRERQREDQMRVAEEGRAKDGVSVGVVEQVGKPLSG